MNHRYLVIAGLSFITGFLVQAAKDLLRRWYRGYRFRKCLDDPEKRKQLGQVMGQQIMEIYREQQFRRDVVGPELLPRVDYRKPK